jgi:homospermidine synthase
MIDLSHKKILFLGYGAVAKCVWNYFDHFFTYSLENIFIVDKFQDTLIGPKLNLVPKKNILVQEIDTANFVDFLNKHCFSEGDVIIDLTVISNTYYFIHTCFSLGLNYINTSIEDMSDKYIGTSIDFQQKVVHDIYKKYKQNGTIRSNILIECGQNPGLIQHYVLYALNEMNKLKNQDTEDDYRKQTLTKVVDDYKIGTIFCSEIDHLVFAGDVYDDDSAKLYDAGILNKDVIYNTWSVGGLLVEGFDKTELVCGGLENNYIKPLIDESVLLTEKIDSLKKSMNNDVYNTVFLKDIGMNNSLNSICPILNENGEIKYTEYNGKLIHHGEVFELARYLGKKAPFMSYVYQLNKYVAASIQNFTKNHPEYDETELQVLIKTKYENYNVLNNIGKYDQERIIGHDSIGCTIYCGDDKIERIFWCGSILSDIDDNVLADFTPTVVQVAAGLLSGLSCIMEPENTSRGLLESCDLDTTYIINKSRPFLGKFFFTEIPVQQFSGKFLHINEKFLYSDII